MSGLVKSGRTLAGRVMSNSLDRTIVVAVTRKVRHPVYGKYVSFTSKFHVHDESHKSRQGDFVLIRECRPIARHKFWVLL